MNQPRTAREAFIASIFSDETAMFRVPSEPEPWDAVSVRLRLQKGSGARVTLLDDANGGARMWPYASDDFFDWVCSSVIPPHITRHALPCVPARFRPRRRRRGLKRG